MVHFIGRSSVGRRGCHRFNESITFPRHGFDVSRARALVAKNRAEPTDDNIKAVMKVDVPVGSQFALDLFAGDQFAGSLEQKTE